MLIVNGNQPEKKSFHLKEIYRLMANHLLAPYDITIIIYVLTQDVQIIFNKGVDWDYHLINDAELVKNEIKDNMTEFLAYREKYEKIGFNIKMEY